MSDEREWPDCPGPPEWGCAFLTAGNIDKEPGSELVVVATDVIGYPTRVSVVKPRAGEVTNDFWHMGNITAVRIESDFFGPGRPAIVALGFNNKLDGFADPPPRPYAAPPGEDKPRTDYDYVSVLMILDPQQMDGLSPPRNNYLPDLTGDQPFAYALLDLPPRTGVTYLPEGAMNRVNPRADDTAEINTCESIRHAVDPDTRPWFRCKICAVSDPPVHRQDRVYIVVDRNLEWQRAESVTGRTIGLTKSDWCASWSPIIQDYKYVIPAPQTTPGE